MKTFTQHLLTFSFFLMTLSFSLQTFAQNNGPVIKDIDAENDGTGKGGVVQVEEIII
jgi:hypothetical protein